MSKDMYHPSDNYERNFLLVKKFGGKFVVFLAAVLLLLRIICIGYLSLTGNEMMEVTLMQLITSKLNPEFKLSQMQNAIMIISCLVSLFFIFVLLNVFFTSRDPSYESSPDLGLSLAYKWSMAQIVVLAACFAGAVIFLMLFAFSTGLLVNLLV